MARNFAECYSAALERLRGARALERLRERDASLWTGGDEASWLGWLDLPERATRLLPSVEDLARRARAERLGPIVVLGMGGSSLGAEALVRCAPREAGAPELVLLDTTDPDRVASVEAELRDRRPLFVSASKSGSTLETALLQGYLLERYPPERFVAITDPGTTLEAEARARSFRAVFHGEPDVGGRFSVLSAFGLVPAALCGVAVREVVRAAETARSQVFGAEPAGETVERLAALLGAASESGGDKLTVLAPDRFRPFGWWLEQLLAESLGKNGRGVLPVLDEAIGAPDRYGPDRTFLWLQDASATRDEGEAAALASAAAALEAAAAPVASHAFDPSIDLGGELYRWELVTALAGHLLGVHPFDQPDVEAAKVATRRYVDALRRGERLPSGGGARSGSVEVSRFGTEAVSSTSQLAELWENGRASGAYVAILAYLPDTRPIARELALLRELLRDRSGLATSLGFGPRYLHSSGQLHKGGPANGRFLLLTAERADGPRIPGEAFGFAEVQLAQALGDAEALAARGRAVVRAHLRGDLRAAIAELRQILGDVARPAVP